MGAGHPIREPAYEDWWIKGKPRQARNDRLITAARILLVDPFFSNWGCDGLIKDALTLENQ